MIQISNNDAATLRRLLGRVQSMAGTDTNSKEIKRRAKILAKTLDKKIQK
jgi:hypothetical protein